MRYSELITELREDFLEDSVEPYQWSDTRLLRYLNEAVDEAVIRAHLLKSTQTIAVISGTADYTLNDDCLELDVLTTTLNDDPLSQQTDEGLEILYGPQWREDTGTPSCFVRKGQTITLYPEPDATDTLTVKYFQRHAKAYSTNEEPEIEEKHHRNLLFWAAYKAFRSPDIDQGDTRRSDGYKADFISAFGERKSALLEAFSNNTPKHHAVQPRRMA